MPKIEGVAAADNSLPREQRRDGPRTHARNHFDKCLRRRPGRQNEFAGAERDCKQGHEQKKNHQKTSHRGTLLDWILLLDFMMRFLCCFWR